MNKNLEGLRSIEGKYYLKERKYPAGEGAKSPKVVE